MTAAFVATSESRRSFSAPSRINPLMARKMLVGIGFDRIVRNVCSSSRPVIPTGMVASTRCQASRSSAVRTFRSRTEVPSPRTMRTQSRQKKMIRASAVATCSPTMNARYGDSAEFTLRSRPQEPPINAGSSTLWPRLETGKSSVTPCRRPMTAASG